MATERPDIAVSSTADSSFETASGSIRPGIVFSPFRRAVSQLADHLESTEQVERLWLMGRMAVALVGVFAALFVLNGTDSAPIIYAGGAVVMVANLFLLLMLRRGMTGSVAVVGLLLDNLVLFAVWTSSLGLAGETRPANDLYLGFFPIFTLWSSRLGFKLGVPYTLIWVGWISWSVHAFLPVGSYEIEQLPIRIAFLTLTSLLGMWTARLLKSQKRIADKSSLHAANLLELDRAKDQFIATVSHELKTPMAAILGFTRLLHADLENSLHRERVETIERNGERLSLLIDDLLDLSRIQSDSLPLKIEPIDVTEFVNKTVSDLNSIIGSRGQVITVDISHGESWINGDLTRLAQVLTNLISNASKYSSPDSEIRVRSGVEQQVLSLTVSDQGDGINSKDQEHLFQPFYRTEIAKDSSVPGTGLGLFISKRIVELHGGELILDSQPGKGTTVVMRLPGVSAVGAAKIPGARQFSNSLEDLEEAG